MTLTQQTVDMLEDVKQDILRDSTGFSMSTWDTCIAARMARRTEVRLTQTDKLRRFFGLAAPQPSLGMRAAAIADFDIFTNACYPLYAVVTWPLHLKKEYAKATTERERAIAASQAIDYFIAKDGPGVPDTPGSTKIPDTTGVSGEK